MAATMPWPTQVLVGVSNMAELMVQSDFAIGAAGSTSWERCCLGLPTAMVVLADNQRFAASQLENVNAVILLKSTSELGKELAECIKKIKNTESFLLNLAAEGARITDGDGCKRVVSAIFNHKKHA
jgi:spore coat polysaccharide biosynthesis predicted glycosyltransferase SpsG